MPSHTGGTAPRKPPCFSASQASQASSSARASGPTPLQLRPSSDLSVESPPTARLLVIGLIARLSETAALRHRRRDETGSRLHPLKTVSRPAHTTVWDQTWILIPSLLCILRLSPSRIDPPHLKCTGSTSPYYSTFVTSLGKHHDYTTSDLPIRHRLQSPATHMLRDLPTTPSTVHAASSLIVW